jgi:hypothetical protein
MPSLERILPPRSPGIRDYAQAEVRERKAEKAIAEGDEDGPGNFREFAELIPERGLPLDMDEFPYQKAWYSDEVAYAREVCWKKAAQVGMSGAAFRWGAWRADEGDTVIIFFPTDDDVTEFGDKRIDPSIDDSAYLLGRIGSVRNKHIKRIGAGWLALRGTQSKATVQSVDADALVFDEYNYLHQGNLGQAERRVAGAQQAGRTPRIRRFGYPTLPGFGIDPIYARSDRRVWHVTCPECSDEQPITWKDNMRWRSEVGGDIHRQGRDEFEDAADVTEAWRACRTCEASFESAAGEPGPMHKGRWIKTRPESERIGFHVPRLIVPRTDLLELVHNSRKTSPADLEAFWNNDLGESYSPTEASLSQEMIDAACVFGGEQQSGYSDTWPVTMGVDVASERELTVRISVHMEDGRRRALWLGEPADFQEVAELVERFHPWVVVVDSMPERRQARGLAATFPGRVFLASYDHRNESDAFRYDPKKNLITINRTEALDAMMDSVRQKKNIPLRTPPKKYVSHLMSPKRRTVEDSKGLPKREYVSTGTDGDDYAHAEVYDMVASEMLALMEQVREVEAAAAGHHIADEQLGFRRSKDIDHYDPGFSGRG